MSTSSSFFYFFLFFQNQTAPLAPVPDGAPSAKEGVSLQTQLCKLLILSR